MGARQPEFNSGSVNGLRNLSLSVLISNMGTVRPLEFPKGVDNDFLPPCPSVPPTRTYPLPKPLPTVPYNPHPLDLTQRNHFAIFWLDERQRPRNQLWDPGGRSPAPLQGLGEGRLALPSSPPPFLGCCWGKFMFLSGLGTDPTLKRKKKERKK